MQQRDDGRFDGRKQDVLGQRIADPRRGGEISVPSTVPTLASCTGRRCVAGNRTTVSLPGSQTWQTVSPQSVWV